MAKCEINENSLKANVKNPFAKIINDSRKAGEDLGKLKSKLRDFIISLTSEESGF
jgi:hypothetical protein